MGDAPKPHPYLLIFIHSEALRPSNLHQDLDLHHSQDVNLEGRPGGAPTGARPTRRRCHHHIHQHHSFLLPHHGLLDGLYLDLIPLGVEDVSDW
jgi:hypothetical protein